MALQNIGAANSDDAFYRYKMPRMITKIEGRGNGIKTNVVNMVEIAKALARPASYTTKYFGCELGAQSKYDEKTGTSHVNGAHETAKLAGLLEKFIKMYVQCYGCGNPETEVVITKTQMITLKCAACGFLSDVDMRDKLTTFILKNPPEQKKSSKDKKAMRRAEKERQKEGEAADAEIKKVKKESVKKKISSKDASSKAASTKKKSSGSDEDHSPPSSQVDENEADTGDDDDDDGDDDVQWQTDTSAEAARQRMQEQLSSATAEMVMLTTEEPKPKTTKKSSPCQNDTKSPDAYKMLVTEIKEFLKKGSPPGQLKSFLDSRSESSQDIMNALFESLFEGVGKGFAKEVMRKKKYLLAAVAAAATQENAVSQTVLLCALEHFYGKSSPEAVKEVALILKSLYDDDMLEEKVILKWYNEGLVGENKSSPIWKNAKPVIEWLQSAESESEEE